MTAATLTATTRAELFTLVRRPAVRLVAGLWMLMGLVFGYLLPYLAARGADVGPEVDGDLASTLPAGIVTTVIGGWPLFGGALAMILGVLVAGSGYGWDTVKTVLTQGPRRGSVLAGQAGALLLVTLVLVLASFVLAVPTSWLIATVESRPADWPAATEVLQGVAAGWLVVAAWATAGLALGVLMRSTALPIGLGLVWVLVVENLVRGFASVLGPLEAAQEWLLGTNAGSLVAALGTAVQSEGGNPGVADIVSGTHATIVLSGYLVVCLGVALFTFRRRDI